MEDPQSTTPLTVDQIISQAVGLRPESAIVNFERDWRRYCVSPTYTSVLDENGNLIDLHFKDATRCVAIYVRVSSLRQRGDVRDDGYSVEHQLRSNIQAAMKEHWAFRIYSDAGLSGFLMTNDSAMMEEVRKAKAELYGRIYDDLLLKNAATWNTLDQIGDMRRFRDSRVADILHGVKEQVVDEKRDDLNWGRVEEALIFRYQYRNTSNEFRPALHALTEDASEVHSVYVTDPDRLSRNQLLFVTLGKLFRKNDIEVYTSTGTAAWLTGTDLTSQLLSIVLPYQAEQRLIQIKQGAISGIVGMLRKGKPHSKLPFWLERGQNGYAQIIPRELPVILKLIQLAVDDEHIGIARLAQMMEDAGTHSPTGGTWQGTTVSALLSNPWLFGSQVIFGREWPMRTERMDLVEGSPSPFLGGEEAASRPLALVTKEQWLRMKSRRRARYQNVTGRPTPDKKLMAGLIKCQCGYGLVYRRPSPARKSPPGYRCNAPSTERRKSAAEGVEHTVLRPDQVDEFFIDLVADHADMLIRNREAVGDTLDQQEMAARKDWETLMSDRRGEVVAALAGLGGGTGNGGPEYQATVDMMLKTVLADEYQRFQEHLERLEAKRSIRSTVQRASGDEIARFREMASGEQNRILRSIIKKVTVEGEPESEYLSVHLHEEAIQLPPIRLETKVYKNGALRRRVPTVLEWILSWQAAS